MTLNLQSLTVGVLREAGASLVAFHLYPFGVAGSSLPLVPSLRSPVERGETPVLFVHGVFHNPTAFAWLKQKLAWKGFRHFDEVNLFTSLRTIATNAEIVGKRVDELCERYGVDRIDIVAHSMGGIIARYYVQVLGGETKVRNLVTLGTPHGGTEWSRFAVLPRLRELVPESRVLAQLDAAGPLRQTQALGISGSLDIFNFPRGCHHWTGVRNVKLKGVGHAGLLFSKRVVRILASQLGDENPVASKLRGKSRLANNPSRRR